MAYTATITKTGKVKKERKGCTARVSGNGEVLLTCDSVKRLKQGTRTVVAAIKRGAKKSQSTAAKSGKRSSSTKLSSDLGGSPTIVQRFVVRSVISAVKKRGGRKATGADVGKAFGIATGMLQRQGFLHKGTRELTKKGWAKENSYTAEEHRDAAAALRKILRDTR